MGFLWPCRRGVGHQLLDKQTTANTHSVYPPGSGTTHYKSASYPTTFHILQEKCKEVVVQCLRKGKVYLLHWLKQSKPADLLFFCSYHTSQRWPEFICEPSGHWKCSANSGELDSVPMTRYLGGLWGSVIKPSWALSGVRTEHQTCTERHKSGINTCIYCTSQKI